jgi:WD40 repeat protein
MSAKFHPKEDLIVSSSMDQTVCVWDITGLHKNTPHTGSGAFKNFDTFLTVKYVLEGHGHGVNFTTFHQTLPLIISAVELCQHSATPNIPQCQHSIPCPPDLHNHPFSIVTIVSHSNYSAVSIFHSLFA